MRTPFLLIAGLVALALTTSSALAQT